MKRIGFPCLAMALTLTACAHQQTAQPGHSGPRVAAFQDWSVFSEQVGGKQLCWVASTPSKWKRGLGRLSPYLLYTVGREELSITFEGGDAPGKHGYLTVGENEYPMAFIGRNGWMRHSSGDKGFVEGMTKVETVMVTSNEMPVEFSAAGFGAAVSKARELCGQV